MDRPTDHKAEVVIATAFGDVATDSRNFIKPIEELVKDPHWRKAFGVDGGRSAGRMKVSLERIRIVIFGGGGGRHR